jgi:hypothetical protein
MSELLEWAERKPEEITPKLLKTYSKVGLRDSIALGEHLWGFLNVNPTGDAYEVFGNITRGDGFEVWRRVLEDTCQKTKAEKLALEHAVMQPKPCANPEQVPMALERWMTSLQAYLDVGGENLTTTARSRPSSRVDFVKSRNEFGGTSAFPSRAASL